MFNQIIKNAAQAKNRLHSNLSIFSNDKKQLQRVLEGITEVCHYSPWKLFPDLSEGVITELEKRGFKIKKCVDGSNWYYVNWD